jgi:hypothetical protein
VASFSLVDCYQCFEGTFCNHLPFSTLKVEGARSSETSVTICFTTRCHIPDDSNLNSNGCETVKSQQRDDVSVCVCDTTPQFFNVQFSNKKRVYTSLKWTENNAYLSYYCLLNSCSSFRFRSKDFLFLATVL